MRHPKPSAIFQILENALKGDSASISRIISFFERGEIETMGEILKKIDGDISRSHIISFVGPPGAGKSTLLAGLSEILSRKFKVAVLLVDPSSTLSGGALLGNRIRMVQKLKDNSNIYVRSFSSGSSLGGLSLGVYFASKLLAACGFDFILIEGVGAGHLDVKPLLYSHTRVIVLTPVYGDVVQMFKSGIMELGDLYVVNKADVADPQPVKACVEELLSLRRSGKGWHFPVLVTEAINGKGLEDLVHEIHNHRAYLESSNEIDERGKIMRMTELRDVVSAYVSKVLDDVISDENHKVLSLFMSYKSTSIEVAYEILSKVFGGTRSHVP
jgi:LAO/AO transport system kinase